MLIIIAALILGVLGLAVVSEAAAIAVSHNDSPQPAVLAVALLYYASLVYLVSQVA